MYTSYALDHDERVVQRCIEGDATAWESIVKTYAGLVFSIARACRLREDQCEDVAQSVFLALAKGLATIKNPAVLRHWIATTARREAGRVRRASIKRSASSEVESEQSRELSVQAEAERAERSFKIRSAFDGLGERCRRLLEALYFERAAIDCQTISERLGLPVGSIGPTRQRCLAKLAEILIDQEARSDE